MVYHVVKVEANNTGICYQRIYQTHSKAAAFRQRNIAQARNAFVIDETAQDELEGFYVQNRAGEFIDE